jgi:hypothetical protein
MNPNIKNESNYETMLKLASALPGVLLANRDAFVKNLMADKDFDATTFRLNIDLSDAILNETHGWVETGVRDWWIDEYRMGEHIGSTLDLRVYFEDGTSINRVIGVDSNTGRVLSSNGKVYQLGRRLVSPIEVAVVAVQPSAATWQIAADTFLGDGGEEKAKKYVEQREEDATKFFKDLKWVTVETGFRYCVQADIYGVRIIHEMQPRRLHATAVWGELFFPGSTDREPIMFPTFDQFIAYMLAKYW